MSFWTPEMAKTASPEYPEDADDAASYAQDSAGGKEHDDFVHSQTVNWHYPEGW